MGRLEKDNFPPQAGQTPLEDSSGLLVNISTREELNAYEFANVNKITAKYLLSRPSDKKAPFTFEWFLKVHREMFGEVWEWAGQIRKTNKSIGIDKIQIREALKLLEKDYSHWTLTHLNPDEITARLHHRLVWIHPFENGNGRWARLITNIHLKKNELPLIEWLEEALLKKTDLRKRYLEALQKADTHDFLPLIHIHRSLQKI